MVPRLTNNAEKSATVQFQDAANLIEEEIDDDIAWATRSSMWKNRVEKASERRTKRAKAQPALILAGHGVSPRVEGGSLAIRNGFTHYPQKREIIRYFRGDVALPERIMSISVGVDPVWWTPLKLIFEVSDAPLPNRISAGVPAPDGRSGALWTHARRTGA